MCGPRNLLGVTFSVSPNHVLADSLCSVRVFKLFSRSIHHIAISRNVVGKSADDNPERYCGRF